MNIYTPSIVISINNVAHTNNAKEKKKNEIYKLKTHWMNKTWTQHIFYLSLKSQWMKINSEIDSIELIYKFEEKKRVRT